MSSHWTVAKSIIFDLFWTYLNKVSPFPCNGRVVGIGKMVARRQNGEAEGHKSDVNSISLLFDRAKTTWLHCSSSSAHLSKSTNSSLYPVWTGRYLQLETASPTKHLPSASTEWRVLVLQISSSRTRAGSQDRRKRSNGWGIGNWDDERGRTHSTENLTCGPTKYKIRWCLSHHTISLMHSPVLF